MIVSQKQFISSKKLLEAQHCDHIDIHKYKLSVHCYIISKAHHSLMMQIQLFILNLGKEIQEQIVLS